MKLYIKITASCILILFTICCFFGNSLPFFGFERNMNRSFFSFLMPDSKSKNSDIRMGMADYRNWVENPENGLISEKNIDEFSFQAFYQPTAYLALAESEKIEKKDILDHQQAYEGMAYFTFKIKCNKTNDELLRYKLPYMQEYYNRLDYYSFKAQNDFSLFDGKDTLSCGLFHFERTFGLAPIITMVIAFPYKHSGEGIRSDLVLSYDEHIFGKGIIRMKFDKETLNNIPQLDYNK